MNTEENRTVEEGQAILRSKFDDIGIVRRAAEQRAREQNIKHHIYNILAQIEMIKNENPSLENDDFDYGRKSMKDDVRNLIRHYILKL